MRRCVAITYVRPLAYTLKSTRRQPSDHGFSTDACTFNEGLLLVAENRDKCMGDENASNEASDIEQKAASHVGLSDFLGRLRSLEADHGPESFPAVRMSDITRLCMFCDEVRRTLPVVDRLQEKLEAGAKIALQDGKWWLFARDGEGIVGADTLRNMLFELVFAE